VASFEGAPRRNGPGKPAYHRWFYAGRFCQGRTERDRCCESCSDTSHQPVFISFTQGTDSSMNLKVSMLAPYISRRAGGLVDSVRNLSRFLKNQHDIGVDVISVKDEFSTEDLARWEDLPVHVGSTEICQLSVFSRTMTSVCISDARPLFPWRRAWPNSFRMASAITPKMH